MEGADDGEDEGDDEADENEDDDEDDEEGELGGDKYGGLSDGLLALSLDLDRCVLWLLPSEGLECDEDELELDVDEEAWGLLGSDDGRWELG